MAAAGESAPSSGLALPDARLALAEGLVDPTTLAPRLPWQLGRYAEDPYAARPARVQSGSRRPE